MTMLPGDGVGPELMHAVKEVFKVKSCGGGWVADLATGMDELSWKVHT